MSLIKRTEDGREVHLSEEYKSILSSLREGAPRIVNDIKWLKDTMSGSEYNHQDRRDADALIEILERIRDHNWDTSTWEEDYRTLTNVPRNTLWIMLHDFQIGIGVKNGAYRAVYHWKIFFARNEKTWPDDRVDDRPSVARIQNIAGYSNSIFKLDDVAKAVNYEAASTFKKAVGWAEWLGKIVAGGGPGGK